MNSEPRLYLIPTPLGKTSGNNSLPPAVIEQIHRIDTFIVESLPGARKFLQWIEHPVPEYEWKLYVYNKRTNSKELPELLDVIRYAGEAGLFSEAGAPAVADPGSELIRQAQQQDITVQPLTGPSSITLALMASGGNGQQFCFHGYLPRDKQQLKQRINQIEQAAISDGYTQLFMETPHRTGELWSHLLEQLQPDTWLGYGQNLTLAAEETAVQEVMMWQATGGGPENAPAIFFLYRLPAGGGIKKKKTSKVNKFRK